MNKNYTLNNQKKLQALEKLILNKLKDSQYYNKFIKDKNLIEKRKFLSLLLLVSTNLSLDELIDLKVKDFLKIIKSISEQLDSYEELDIYSSETENVQRKSFYLSIELDSYGKKLHLNPAFNQFFKEDLYYEIITNKNYTEPVLSSLMNHKPLSAVNLKKDINEQIVELI
uniref:Uncharacterized protein n=1 Tax=Ulva intestinalis TaxID=3116 RepID=A0A8F4XLE2_ULVIN|nr:hypothetical protein [Ulva intestinalis]